MNEIKVLPRSQWRETVEWECGCSAESTDGCNSWVITYFCTDHDLTIEREGD